MTHIVLLVDDDLEAREALACLLESQGHTVIGAANGQEALARLRQMRRPCIIILDLMMPVMNGWALQAELSKDPELADVPIVVLSGSDDLEREAQRLSAVDYVRKPVDVSRLYGLIDAHSHC